MSESFDPRKGKPLPPSDRRLIGYASDVADPITGPPTGRTEATQTPRDPDRLPPPTQLQVDPPAAHQGRKSATLRLCPQAPLPAGL